MDIYEYITEKADLIMVHLDCTPVAVDTPTFGVVLGSALMIAESESVVWEVQDMVVADPWHTHEEQLKFAHVMRIDYKIFTEYLKYRYKQVQKWFYSLYLP